MATIADWARPALGLYSWTAGCTEIPEARRKNIRLSVMAVWFMVHLSFPKKMYMTIVRAIAAAYIPNVEPIKTPLHARESCASICSKQYSAQVCAKSTKRTNPRRRKSMAEKKEM